MVSLLMQAFILAIFCLTSPFVEARLVATEQDSCTTGIKTLTAKIDKLQADFKAFAHSLNPQGSSYASCKEIYQDGKSRGNTAYMLQTDVGKVPVYCHMTGNETCGGGGWTLVMKIDGHKPTFNYDSSRWSNRAEYNRLGGKTGFDARETKLPTYWNTPFSKICLAMKIGYQIRSIVIEKSANSLYSLIADGHFRPTSLGRNKWKSLIGSEASLQRNCNKEGFNVVSNNKGWSRARIGILGNNENDCKTCASRVGFGTGGNPVYSNRCGNVASANSDNGVRNIRAMGYILVQ